MSGLLIAIFLGWAGGYRFYKKQPVLGVVYLLTFGIMGVGWIIDVIMALRTYLSSKQPQSYSLDCQIMGSWAECKKNEAVQRWDVQKTLSVGTPLILETAYYKGNPFYLVCAPNGMDIGSLPREVSQDLLQNHPHAALTATLTHVDKEVPSLKLTVSD